MPRSNFRLLLVLCASIAGAALLGLGVAELLPRKRCSARLLCKRCAATTILRGMGRITRDGGNVVFASWHAGDGWLGRWGPAGMGAHAGENPETESNALGLFEWRATGLGCAVIRELRGAGRIALMSHQDEGGGVRSFRRLAIFDPRTLENFEEFVLPKGPDDFCFVPPDTLVTPLWAPSGGATRLVVWRVAGNVLRQQHDVLLPGEGEHVFSRVCHAGGTVVLFLATPLQPESADKASPVGIALGGAPPAKPETEIVAYDLAKRSVISRSRTSPGGMPLEDPIEASEGGKYAVVVGRDAIELRSLPSLRLLRRLELGAYVTCGAVSDDGRYVAFGGTSLKLWDTTVEKAQTLDALSERIITSPRFDSRDWDAWLQYCPACVQFVGPHQQLAVATHDGKFSLWDPATRRCIARDQIADVFHLAE